MKEILFLSGKGGTGKTSLTSSMAELAGNCLVCDYDVDASNMFILMQPSQVSGHDFIGAEWAVVDEERCISCGICDQYCRFGAIKGGRVDPLQCEGCGFCSLVCPLAAIRIEPRSSGRWFFARTYKKQPFFYAELRPSQANSGKLVSKLKEEAWKQAASEGVDLILSDGPPGLGCPVIASLNKVSLVVMVTEPSRSGFSDLKRLWELLRMRGIKGALVVNKADLNLSLSDEIESWAGQQGICLLGRIPHSETLAGAISRGQNPATYPEIRALAEPIWQAIISNCTNGV